MPFEDFAPVLSLSLCGPGRISGGEKSKLGTIPGCDVVSTGVSGLGSLGVSEPDGGKGGAWDIHRTDWTRTRR